MARLSRRAPWCWSYQRGPILAAIWLGSILTVLPIVGIQLPLAMVLAVFLRANVTLTAALQFLSTPITFAPIFFATYSTGMPMLEAMGLTGASVGWGDRFNALMLGGVVVGSGLAAVLHLAVHLMLSRRDRRRRRTASLLPRDVAPQNG